MRIITNKPIALESEDHLHPAGALDDRWVNGKEFWSMFKEEFGGGFKILDLGTGVGQIVISGIEAGYDIYGIDGTDACLALNTWKKYHGTRLFLADVTEPFTIVDWSAEIIKFDFITLFDFLEHIPEEKLGVLITNIKKHLKKGGTLLGTVAHDPTQRQHVTNYIRAWWLELFAKYGFVDKGHHEMLTIVRKDSIPKKHFWMQWEA